MNSSTPQIDIDAPPPREQWEAEPLKLPDSTTIFNQLRQSADRIFDVRDLDDWLDKEIDPDVLEVGEMRMAKAVVQREQAKVLDDNERYERWDEEVREKIESAREEVTTYFDAMTDKTKETEWRLREEELAAREHLVYEYQAKEAELLGRLRARKGYLQQVPSDKFSWTIEWKKAPQEFDLNVTSIRGMRNKVRDGYYVILVSILDVVGGQTLRFSTGDKNIDCTAALPPMRYVAKVGEADRFINRSVNMLCPARAVLQTHVCLLFELWQLKVGKFDPVDKVVGWGVWPLVNKDFNVVEGKFRVPLLKGEVDPSIDTYRSVTNSLQYNLEYWLGNLYFEIKLDRKEHKRLVNPSVSVKVSSNMTGDALRLDKTVDDFRGLVVAKLPPRLFFDDVSQSSTASSGLRRRFFGSEDQRMLNAALWEKRAMLEEERTTLLSELALRKTRSMLTDEDVDIKDLKLRREIDATGVTRQSRFPEVQFAEEEDAAKARDSHILLLNHHCGIMSQRDFFFLGRRYRDRLAVSSAVLEYDMGINRGGPWDKLKVVESVLFCAAGLLARAAIHGLGLYLYLQFLNVPLTKNEWGPFYVDIRFSFTTRFYPKDTLIATFIGHCTCIFFFNVIFLFIFGLLAVFERFPYAVTRFLFWFGVATVGDPIFASIQEFALGNTATGDPFLLVNEMVREEGSAISGLLLTVAAYSCLSIIQLAALYGYISYVHLNGRVDDVYNRIMSPESSFFIPHDLEASDQELREAVKLAKAYRNDAGNIKMVRVYELNHYQTCFFRSRLFKLLNILTNEPDEWVSQYIDVIPLRRPRYVKDLIEHNLGSYKLGGDVISFMRRHFPHLTVMTHRRIGDDEEDLYYESELIEETQRKATPKEDDAEMRTLLKAYFQAQVFGGKPAEWEAGSTRNFIVNDAQMLADVIFFETSTPTMRLLYLTYYLRDGFDGLWSANPERPETHVAGSLPHFDRTEPITSLNGKPVQGSIVHIVLENPVKGLKQLSRSFVVTPYGMIIEPKSKSFSLLLQHTSDDPEFWAAKAIQMDTETEKSYSSWRAAP